MNKENLLGAPTEGLGQTVTFAGNVRGGGSQLGADGFSPLRSGVQGAQGASAIMGQGPQAVKDPTMALLAKAGQDILAPHIEKARTEAFLNGMQQVAGGRALADVAKDEPWYMKVFGDSDLIAGARAYTQQTKAQETVSALQDNMEELSKLPGQQFNEHVRKLLDSNMTGDSVADAGLMQAMSRTLPGLYSAHARAHVKHLQFEAATAESAMRGSAGKSLQQQYAEFATNGVASDAPDRVIADAAFIGTLGQAEGRDDKSYAQGLGRSFQEWAEAGNFHAIRVAKAAGYFDKVDPAMRPKIEDLIDRNAAQAINSKQAAPLQQEWLQLRMGAQEGAIPDERLAEAIDKLNTKARDMLGIEGNFISRPSEEQIRLHNNSVMRAQEAEAMRDMKRAKEEAAREARADARSRAAITAQIKAQAAQSNLIDQYLLENKYANLSNGQGSPTEKDIDNRLVGLTMGVWKNPAGAPKAQRDKAMDVLASALNSGAKANTYKDVLGSDLGLAFAPDPSAASDQAFIRVTQQFKALYEKSPMAAKKLFGDDYTKLYYVHMQTPRADGSPSEQTLLMRPKLADPMWKPSASDMTKLDAKKEAPELVSVLKDKYTSIFGDRLRDFGPDTIERLAPYYNTAPGRTPKERAEVALGAYEAAGGTFLAGLPLQLRSANAATGLTELVAAGKREINAGDVDKYAATAIESKFGGHKPTAVALSGNLLTFASKREGYPTQFVTLTLDELGDEIVRIKSIKPVPMKIAPQR